MLKKNVALILSRCPPATSQASSKATNKKAVANNQITVSTKQVDEKIKHNNVYMTHGAKSRKHRDREEGANAFDVLANLHALIPGCAARLHDVGH